MKEKGFTLIELLAVIVILAIIALIATPIILGVIEKARVGSAESSALGYIDAVEKQISINLLDKEIEDIVEGTYTVEELTNLNVKVKGTKPNSGEVEITNKVKSATLCIGNYKVEYKNNKAVTTKDNNCTTTGDETSPTYTVYANGTDVYFNPETGAKCTVEEVVSTTGTKTGCMKWYAFNDSGVSSSTINLILDHNTTAVVAWNSSGNSAGGMKEVATSLTNDISTWNSSLNARLITADEIAKITENTSFSQTITTYTNWFYLDSISQIQSAKSKGASKYAWLFDYTNGCTSNGCNIEDNSNQGYWTSSVALGHANLAWRVSKDGGIGGDYVNNSGYKCGVRPVITVSKDNFK